jgi:BlaR1 peptidase M56
MNWLYYLLEANLYLLLFYGFFRLFLQRETFYNSNRYYLLLSSITSFILPILQLGFLNPAPQVVDLAATFPMPISHTKEELAKIAATSIPESIDYTTYLYPIYLFICCGFTLKLIVSLSKIVRLWLTAKKDRKGPITIIELEKEKSAFSFFNLLFIHPQLAERQTVVKHEMVHIEQKHSLDILFFEIVQAICWFNPILYFLKKDIKLLHEYIADELTTGTDIQKHDYAMFLIENSFGVVPTPLTNQIFNQSILKRRINMLNKKRTTGWARFRLLLALPLGGAMLCTSTMAFTKDYGYIDLLPEKYLAQDTLKNVKKSLTNADKKDMFYSKADKRYFLINGKVWKTKNKYKGILNADQINFLDEEKAIEKYGVLGKNGAVEITGTNIKYLPLVNEPPAIETPPAGKKLKRFPPPIVKPDPKTNASLIKEIDMAPTTKIKVQALDLASMRKVEGIELLTSENQHNKPEIEGTIKQKVQGIKLENSQTIPGKELKKQNLEVNPIPKVQELQLNEPQLPQTNPALQEVVVVGYSNKKADNGHVKEIELSVPEKQDKSTKEVVVVGYRTKKN